MAIVRIPSEGKELTDPKAIGECLARCGIDYEQRLPMHPLPSEARGEEILQTYAREIDELKARYGYVAADVIDVNRQTPGLEAMLSKFNREHWHNEDEVRFIVSGHGLFHIHPGEGPVVAIEVEPGDLIRVPRETLHWFDLCLDRHIRAIRLFQDAGGWTPYYTESNVDQQYQPVCFGFSDVAGVSPGANAI
jgi:1,2-dihydroxy-3-keto-5-methylthiopentene dioxygenase